MDPLLERSFRVLRCLPLLFLGACLSPNTPIPVHYYSAQPVIIAGLAGAGRMSIKLTQVDAVGAIRDSLTLRDGIELFYDEEQRWVELPSDIIRRAIVRILEPLAAGTHPQLAVMIEDFAIELPANQARVVLRAELLAVDGRTRTFSVQGRAKAKSGAAHDRMQALAKAVVAAIQALQRKLVH